MAKSAETKAVEAANRKKIQFHSETFPALIKAIMTYEPDGQYHHLRAVFDAYTKACKMADEAGVDLSLHGMKLTDVDTFVGLRWFIEGSYVWDMTEKLNRAKYDYVHQLSHITQWEELDEEQKRKFDAARLQILNLISEKTTYDLFKHY